MLTYLKELNCQTVKVLTAYIFMHAIVTELCNKCSLRTGWD